MFESSPCLAHIFKISSEMDISACEWELEGIVPIGSKIKVVWNGRHLWRAQ